jgi:kynurenine formamidase
MRMVTSCLVLSALLMLRAATVAADPAPADPFAGVRIVDLTHPLNGQSIFWPTAERFQLEKVADGPTEKGFHYAANNFRSAEHGGTHLDAPVHFAKGGWTTERVPLEKLIGRAVVVDVSRECAADANHLVSIRDFEAWEKSHGQIGADEIVLIRTDYSSRWPDAQSYLGTPERGPQAVARLHFPGLEPAAARWLVERRRIKAVGIDTASIDYGQSTLFESHRALAAHNVPILENLSALRELPARGATLIALPAKIEGGRGGPVRAIALVSTAPPK